MRLLIVPFVDVATFGLSLQRITKVDYTRREIYKTCLSTWLVQETLYFARLLLLKYKP